MKIYTITDPQIQEIAGRLNALTVQGIANSAHVVAIVALLEQIAKPVDADQSNIVELKDKAHG